MKLMIRAAWVPLSFCLANSTTAHHAFSAQFDAEKPFEATGTVTRVDWRNPHTWFYIDVDDGKGNVESWAIELASPNLLMRNGWNRDSMKIGDVVQIEGYLAKDGTRTANAKRVVLTSTGQTVLTGPNAGARR